MKREFLSIIIFENIFNIYKHRDNMRSFNFLHFNFFFEYETNIVLKFVDYCCETIVFFKCFQKFHDEIHEQFE